MPKTNVNSNSDYCSFI